MFADHASSATMAANWGCGTLFVFVYVLLDTLRRRPASFPILADVTSVQNDLPCKLLKLGAQARTSVRRIPISAIASGCPNQAEFALAHIYLRRAFSSA